MTSPSSQGNLLPLGSEGLAMPPVGKKKKPGRTPSLIWQLLTDEPDPQRRNSATCKHCKKSVAYYKKSEQAIRHLKKCVRFQEMQHQFAFMNQFSDHLPLYNQKVLDKTPVAKRLKADHSPSDRVATQAQMDVHLQATAALGSVLDQAVVHHAQVMNQIAMQQSLSESLIETMPLKEDFKENDSNNKLQKLRPFSKTQSERFDEEMAMHVFVTGMAFDAIEESHLARAMALVRPTIKLPTKKSLETNLMMRCYEKIYKQVWGKLSSSFARVCLKREAWSNWNLYQTSNAENTYVTYLALYKDKRFFLEVEKTIRNESPLNSILIAQDIKRMMQPIVSNISGVVTGSTEYHSRAWNMLKAEYPTKFFYGCICHALHLAIMDIFGPPQPLESDTSRQVSSTQGPMEFPFQDLVELTINCNELLSFFSSTHYAPKYKMFGSQLVHTMKGLANATSTMSWGTLAARFRVLMQAEDILQSIVSAPDFLSPELSASESAIRTNLKAFVLNVNWKLTLEKAVTILTPIELILYKFQDDHASISDVYFESKHLLTDFDAVFGLTTVELEYLKKVITEHWQYVLSEAHGLAFLLDPRYIGKSMTRDYREQIEELIFTFPETDQDTEVHQERRQAMTEEYTDYVMYAKNQRNNRTYKWEMLEKGTRTPLQFWQTDADDWPHLKSLALTLFSLAPSSVASEKTLCKSTLTQARRRNKLSFDDMRRLAFICINDSQLTGNRVTGEVQSSTLPDFAMESTALSPDGMMMWMI